MKKHDPAKDYNVYWELLLSSPERLLLGFGFAEGIRDIQRGIRDFVAEYRRHFQSEPFMFAISGRDACAPMLLAAGHRERYLKKIAERFELDKGE